jgi:hypothetical protein
VTNIKDLRLHKARGARGIVEAGREHRQGSSGHQTTGVGGLWVDAAGGSTAPRRAYAWPNSSSVHPKLDFKKR